MQEEFHTVIVHVCSKANLFFNNRDPEIPETLKTLIPDVETLKLLLISLKNTAERILLPFFSLVFSPDYSENQPVYLSDLY